MEDGKTTGRKPKWWSRPAHKAEQGTEPDPVIPPHPEPAQAPDGDGDFTLAAPTPSTHQEPPTSAPAAAAHQAAPVGPTAPADAPPQPNADAPEPAPSADGSAQAGPAQPAPEQAAPAPAQPAPEQAAPAPVDAPHAGAAPADAAPQPDPAPVPAAEVPHPAAEPAAELPHPATDVPHPAPAPAPATDVPHPAPAPAADVPQPAPAPAAGGDGYRGAGQPLHQPDEYSTPPYGGPGPWAPAPPVQRPVPPQGAPMPAPAPAPMQAPAPAPAAMAAPAPAAPASPWAQYDPWGAPGAAAPVPEGKGKRRSVGCAGVLALVLAAGILGGGVGAYIERTGGLTTVELPQAEAQDIGRAPDSVAGIAARALPGVVTLHVKGGGSAGTGTGFVLDNKGHILTNNHVVDPAGSSGDISVTFSSGETAEATLVGKDSGYDLAVVRVKGVENLKPLPLGNSDNVRVGDPVVAIGAPFDLQNTVTSGIISAKERPITAGGEKGDGSDISYVDALQTDAPINPGNSGGPLLDSKAQVIGINSAIRAAGNGENPTSGQSGSIGLGFAIPINQGKRVAEELINTGKATHPVIGVSLDMQYDGDGARVGDKGKDNTPSVTPGGPAAKAGIRPGDVITKVDGQRVHNGEELIVKIRAHRPGDRLTLTVVRGGDEQTRTLTLGSAQDS
ncbi:S1C family serine protease [Streptomyces tritici]|uniref:S1C family serine protease n=1 Tax=Streptomyces tritici TaxID=2054410 RepID=UPI003AEF34F6